MNASVSAFTVCPRPSFPSRNSRGEHACTGTRGGTDGDKTRLCTHSVGHNALGERRGHAHTVSERRATKAGDVRSESLGGRAAVSARQVAKHLVSANQEQEYNSGLTSTMNGAVHSFLSFFIKSFLVYFKL